ncbi:MAG: helix-turn-helix transcriptional regulator, partial [Syntrophobacteraceae bacterium]
IHDPQGRLLLMTGVATDVTERRKMEDEVRRSRDELELRVQERTKTLADTNAALRLLLKLREEDRQISREAVLANIKHSVQPYIEKLKSCRLSGEASTYLDLVETKINEIASSFIRTMSDKFLDLTPMEIRVGELIRDGRTTKEMAELLHLSPGTIRYHRENLRQKLGIKGKAFNLQTFLRNLQ